MATVVDRRPIPANNYSIGRTDVNGTSSIDMIILHHQDGTMEQTDAHFKARLSNVSAHLGIALDDARIWEWVDDNDTAYHAGIWSVNKRSIGIECEDKQLDIGEPHYAGLSPFNDDFYNRLANVVADKCRQYKILCDRQHIKGHREIVPTGCPGTLDVDRVVTLARTLLIPTPIGVNMWPKRMGQVAEFVRAAPNELVLLDSIYAYESHPEGRTIRTKVRCSRIGPTLITVYPPVDPDADATLVLDADPCYFIVDIRA